MTLARRTVPPSVGGERPTPRLQRIRLPQKDMSEDGLCPDPQTKSLYGPPPLFSPRPSCTSTTPPKATSDIKEITFPCKLP